MAAMLAGTIASVRNRAIERPSAEPTFIVPPSLNRIPSTLWRPLERLWRKPNECLVKPQRRPLYCGREVRIGLDVAQHQLLWPELAERGQFAEAARFDGAWVFDHFTPLYGDRNGPCMEAWTLLAALAAITSRIRLGVLVTGITYRHPSVLATEAITVDHISGGRRELGRGPPCHQPEHEELGIPFPPLK